jgi:hypothetical protein
LRILPQVSGPHHVRHRWLETADEYFDYWGSPGQGRWKIYGLDLPDMVLEKNYHKNAERIFGQFKTKPMSADGR